MNQNDTTVRIRLVAIQPPDEKEYGAQYGIPDSKYRKIYAGLRLPDGNVRFDLELRARRVQGVDTPNFLGAWVIGTPDRRALYLHWQPGDPNDTAWERRLKVILSTITWQQIREMERVSNGVIAGEVAGQRQSGGPANGVATPDWGVVEAKDFHPIT